MHLLLVLVDVKSDGSIPDYQDVGWLQGIMNGKVVISKSGGVIVTEYAVERVKKLVFLQES